MASADLSSPPEWSSASTDFEVTNPSPSAANSDSFRCGVDFGSYHTVVCAADAATPLAIDVEPNDLSARSTPTVVSYSCNVRSVGEAAKDKLSSIPESTFAILPLLLCVETQRDLDQLFERFGPLVTPCLGGCRPLQEGQLTINMGFKSYSLSIEQIISVYLRRMVSYAVEGRKRKHGTDSSLASLLTCCSCIALPDTLLKFKEEQVALRLSRACRTGVVDAESARYCSQTSATVACWSVKHIQSLWNGIRANKQPSMTHLIVSFFNCGFSETSFALLIVTTDDLAQQSLELKNYHTSTPVQDVLEVGTFDFVKRLALHFEDKLQKQDSTLEKALHKVYQTPSTVTKKELKAALRALDSGEKFLKELSGLTVAHQSYSTENDDYQVEINRDEFEALIAPELEKIKSFVQTQLQSCQSAIAAIDGTPHFLGCEVVGGGSRIPRVQAILEEAFARTSLKPSDAESVLRRTLDGSAAAATGATYAAAGLPPCLQNIKCIPSSAQAWESAEQRSHYMATERELREIESAEIDRLHKRNLLETKLMEIEALIANKVAGTEKLRPLVETENDWLSSNSDSGSKEDYEQRIKTLDEQLAVHCAAYLEEQRKEAERKTQVIEESARAKQLKAEGEVAEDHDTRQLPNSQRLQRAKLNKEEGSVAWKAGNKVLGLKFYNKAVAHLEKMFDTSPAEQKERDELLGSLFSNIALIYLTEALDSGNTDAADRVINYCGKALAIKSENAKTYYRRGKAYELKKEYVMALADLKKSKSLQGEATDKATLQAIHAVKAKQQKAQMKEKAMYGSMFK